MASFTAARSRPAGTGGAAGSCGGWLFNAQRCCSSHACLWPTFLRETELYARGFAEKGYTKLTVEVQLGEARAVVQFQRGREGTQRAKFAAICCADSLVVRSQIAVEIGVRETEVLHTQGVNVGAAVGEPGNIPPKVVVDFHCDADQVVN